MKDGLIKYDLAHPGDWSEVILKGIQIGLANPLFKNPDANSNDPAGLDLVSMPANATPMTEYRYVPSSAYLAAQDQWIVAEILRIGDTPSPIAWLGAARSPQTQNPASCCDSSPGSGPC
jgi:hypothetical protein